MKTYFFDRRKTGSIVTKKMFQMATGLQNNICESYVTNKTVTRYNKTHEQAPS
jgi:hypothetical protein